MSQMLLLKQQLRLPSTTHTTPEMGGDLASFHNTKEQEQGSLYVGGDEVWLQLATSAGIGSDARGLGGTGPLLSTLQAVLT